MRYDRTVSPETLDQMLQHIEPTWTITDATPATGGHHIVYLLTVETETGTRECVLKATPPEKEPMCDVEARMLAIVGDNTTVPVPEVFGVVDEHEDLPAPFFLASTLPGEDYQRTEMDRFSDDQLETLARSCGRHLASLHDLDLVDSYGYVGVEYDRALSGETPSSDPAHLVVHDPTDDWQSCLRESVKGITAGLVDTRFEDVTSMVEPALDVALDDLSGEFGPVVCRIDNSLDNLLVDAAAGEVTAFLDWEFQFAGTPAYDLAFVEHSLCGGIWTFLPDVPDRRETVRNGLLAGYRAADETEVVAQFEANRDCYALLAACHAMWNYDAFFDQVGVTDARRELAADPLRDRVRVQCRRIQS